MLKPAIENQIQAKKAKEQKGKFVPEWKNLKTWINQRCWEEDVSSNEKNNIPEYLIGFTE